MQQITVDSPFIGRTADIKLYNLHRIYAEVDDISFDSEDGTTQGQIRVRDFNSIVGRGIEEYDSWKEMALVKSSLYQKFNMEVDNGTIDKIDISVYLDASIGFSYQSRSPALEARIAAAQELYTMISKAYKQEIELLPRGFEIIAVIHPEDTYNEIFFKRSDDISQTTRITCEYQVSFVYRHTINDLGAFAAAIQGLDL